MMVLLLLSLLHIVALSSAATVSVPSSDNVVKMKSKVKWMAEQLVVRLNKDFQVPPNLMPASHVDDLDGLTSIVSMLDGYNSLLSETLGGVPQIKLEVSSLTEYLRYWGEEHCDKQRHKPSAWMQELHMMKESSHSVSMETINRLKTFLNLLMKNLEKLEKC
ncbi:leptin a [Gouania willdenowi]|uniref:Leptin-like n=1 Tax=Gouania willdenowi TaxID=441366 RepID=A0A8C5N8M2_GOUWI|nr:leptin-like [Gouania willdenowi]